MAAAADPSHGLAQFVATALLDASLHCLRCGIRLQVATVLPKSSFDCPVHGALRWGHCRAAASLQDKKSCRCTWEPSGAGCALISRGNNDLYIAVQVKSQTHCLNLSTCFCQCTASDRDVFSGCQVMHGAYHAQQPPPKVLYSLPHLVTMLLVSCCQKHTSQLCQKVL